MNRLTATTVRNTRYSCSVELSDTASQLKGALLLSLDRDRRSPTATTTTTTSTDTVTAIMLRGVQQGSRDGTLMRAHQCGPGSIRSLGVICGLSLLLVLVLASRVFLRVLRFYSLHKNQHFQIPTRPRTPFFERAPRALWCFLGK